MTGFWNKQRGKMALYTMMQVDTTDTVSVRYRRAFLRSVVVLYLTVLEDRIINVYVVVKKTIKSVKWRCGRMEKGKFITSVFLMLFTSFHSYTYTICSTYPTLLKLLYDSLTGDISSSLDISCQISIYSTVTTPKFVITLCSKPWWISDIMAFDCLDLLVYSRFEPFLSLQKLHSSLSVSPNSIVRCKSFLRFRLCRFYLYK